jgi:hypothetical protein
LNDGISRKGAKNRKGRRGQMECTLRGIFFPKKKNMKKNLFYKSLFLLLVLINSFQLAAHRPNETHTVIQQSDNQLLIQIEFPWTIKDAVLKSLDINQKEKLTDATALQYLQNYVEENFQIIKKGKIIKALHFRLVPQEHGHSFLGELGYPKHDLSQLKIKNTLLFNLYEAQRNYNKIIGADKQELIYYTDQKTPAFIIGSDGYEKNWLGKIAFVFFGLLIGIYKVLV